MTQGQTHHLDNDTLAWIQALSDCHRAVKDMLDAGIPAGTPRNHSVNPKGDQQAWFDIEADRITVESLTKREINATIWSEEREERLQIGNEPGPIFVIDPVDGSTNAKRALKPSGYSVAICDPGETVSIDSVRVGFVGELETEDAYVGIRGAGAFRLGASPTELVPMPRFMNNEIAIENSLICFELGHRTQRVVRLIEQAASVRALGASSRGLLAVATGAADAYVDVKGSLTPENYLGGARIIAELGGSFLGDDGRPIQGVSTMTEGRSLVAASSETLAREIANTLD